MNFDSTRYSRVSRRMWNDAKFKSLSQPKPSAAWLFVRLLTAPELNSLPGLFQAWPGGLAQSMGWPERALLKCYAELERNELALADWSAGLVWLPNGIKHNPPANPNVVCSWRTVAQELPECALLDRALDHFASFLTELGPDWIAAWHISESRAGRPEKISKQTRDEVQARDGSNCRYCAITVNWKDRRGPSGGTYDHVDPAGTATPENIVIA
ncbi:MAG TPA: hypothetical protein VK524_34315, partial [Polyangiaceae bacterium]|nr:hypothetical protein [Polyangiaceae bacterium]